MAKLCIMPGSPSVSLIVFISDSTSAEGLGKTGLTYSSSGLTCYYARPGAIAQSVTLAYLASPTAAWVSGGFVEISAANMPGLYRFDVPPAAITTGARSVVVMLKGATGMSPVLLEIDLRAEIDVRYWKGTVAPNNSGDTFTYLPTYTNQVLAAIAAMRGADDDTLKTISDHLDVLPTSTTDAMLLRDWEAVTGTVPDRSTLNALRFLRNKWAASGGTLSVYKEDDETVAWTALLTTNANPAAITGVVPQVDEGGGGGDIPT